MIASQVYNRLYLGKAGVGLKQKCTSNTFMATPRAFFRATMKLPNYQVRGRVAVVAAKKGDGEEKKRKKKKGPAAEKKGPVIVIDNYDSFTYNLCQYLGSLGCEYTVFKNDEISVNEIRKMNPAGILVSPGPGTPEDSGISLEVVRELGPDFPLFGVCMGHQCIGQVFGGNIVRAQSGVMHGKTSPIDHTDTGVLHGLSSPLTVARYHSLVIDRESFPSDMLEMTATSSEDGMIMAVQHQKYRHIQGVQFHPESCITEQGMEIMRNFLKIVEHGVDIREEVQA